MPEPSVAFIGAGNMATSLIRGLLSQDTNSERIRVADPFPEQLEAHATLGVQTFSDNNAATDGASVIVLAVKPQVAKDVVSTLNINNDQVLVSIAAGINLTSLTNWTSNSQPIVRCMPNTPALMSAGMSALFANPCCSDEQKVLAEQVMRAAGKTVWLENERQIDAATAVSGSGPAYFFQLMEAMIDAGVTLGLSRDTASLLATQTAYGAAVMARDGDDQPAVLRQKVTSPGGTTAAALEVMTQAGLPDIIASAVNAADVRAAELAKEFGS